MDLYVFEVTSGEGEAVAGRLTDLTVDQHFHRNGESAAVQSTSWALVKMVVRVFRSGRDSRKRRSAWSGAGNMKGCYLEHYDGSGWEAPQFIATLSGGDSATGMVTVIRIWRP